VTGLVKKRPGPKSAHKLTDDILAFIEEKVKDDKPYNAEVNHTRKFGEKSAIGSQ
jgi:hypothetical protein